MAGPVSAAVQETVAFLSRQAPREVAKEGAESLTRRLTILTTRHGEDALIAIRDEINSRRRGR